MSVNINAANISSARFAGSTAPGTPASGFVQLYFDTSEDLATRKDNGGGITIATSPGSGNYTLTIPATGTVALLSGAQTFTGKKQFDDDIVMANGKGIDFSATPGTGTSEIFSDYEEGTWTPTLIGASTPGSGTYSTQFGRYTKIGRLVFWEANITCLTHTRDGLDNVRVSSLPFTGISGTTGGSGFGFTSSIDFPAGYTAISIQTGTTNLGVFVYADNAVVANITDFVDTWVLGGFYVAA